MSKHPILASLGAMALLAAMAPWGFVAWYGWMARCDDSCTAPELVGFFGWQQDFHIWLYDLEFALALVGGLAATLLLLATAAGRWRVAGSALHAFAGCFGAWVLLVAAG